jgi:hypothetical protein
MELVHRAREAYEAAALGRPAATETRTLVFATRCETKPRVSVAARRHPKIGPAAIGVADGDLVHTRREGGFGKGTPRAVGDGDFCPWQGIGSKEVVHRDYD